MAGLTVKSAAGRWVLLTTVLGSGMTMLDGTVVNVALPKIGRSLHADLASLQWVLNAYMLTLAGLILLGGALGDRYGRRRVFIIGAVWFSVASLLCGLAVNAEMLIASRALQGIGGALLMPGSLAIIQATFAEDQRARAIGAWSGLGGIAAAIGPFLGGWLVDGPGWRWAFLINLPLGVVTVAVAARHVPENHDPTAHGRFDVLGAAVGAISLGAISYALIRAAEGWSVTVAVAAVVGVVMAGSFVWLERRERNPMLPLSIFGSRQFSVVNVVTFGIYAALSGIMFLLGMELQLVSGFSALVAGAALVPLTILMLLLSARSGELTERIGPRIPLSVGPVFCAGGVLMMLRIGPSANYWADVLPAVLVLGIGMVLLVAPLTATVLAAAPVEHAGVASGVNNAVARAAGLIAVAALPLVAGSAARDALGPGFDTVFQRGVWVCAALMAVSAGIAWAGVRNPDAAARAKAPEPQCKVNCAAQAPPLETTGAAAQR